MTISELIQRARRQLNASVSEVDIAACVMQASSKVAHMVMRDDALRGLLQQEYPVTLDANGEGNLLTAVGSVTAAAGEILIDGVRFGAVIDGDFNALQPLLHYADFIRPQSVVFGYYTIKDRATILTRALGSQVNAPNEIQSVASPLTITASYTPASVSNFPAELEDLLVQTLVDVVVQKTTPANANA